MSEMIDPALYEHVRRFFDYDPETGLLTWKVDRPPRTKRGDAAGFDWTNARTGQTYRVIGMTVPGTSSRVWRAHRLIFLWMTGGFPAGDVDHINGNGLDNRWSNLREATRAQNSANTRRARSNTSGFKGVNFHKRSQKYRATIKANGKAVHLGLFETAEDAHAAYIAAAKKHFGEFARAA